MELKAAVKGEWETLLENLGFTIDKINNHLPFAGEDYCLGLSHSFHWVGGEATCVGWVGSAGMPRAQFSV